MARQKLGPWYRFAVVVLQPPVLPPHPARWRNRSGCRPPAASWSSPTTSRTSTRWSSRTTCTTTAGCRGSWPRRRCSTCSSSGRSSRGASQIPVLPRVAGGRRRVSATPSRRCGAGECVVVYAEGTLTRDPDLWPMAGKTGAARIALATGCPVLPMAQWGPQDLLAPYGKRPHLFPPPTMHGHARRRRSTCRPVGRRADRARSLQEATDAHHGRGHRAGRGAARRAAAGRPARPARAPGCPRPARPTSATTDRRPADPAQDRGRDRSP